MPSDPTASNPNPGLTCQIHDERKTQSYSYSIRPATLKDLPCLPDVERSAAGLFRSVAGLESLADDEPMSEANHRERLAKWEAYGIDYADGGTWVAVAGEQEGDERDGKEEVVVGFLVADILPVVHGEAGVGSTVRDESSTLDQQQTDAHSGSSTAQPRPEAIYFHIDELSISKHHQRRGLAGKLLNTLKTFVEQRKPTYVTSKGRFYQPKNDHGEVLQEDDFAPVLGLSLTTFLDVPFNAQFYAKFGFRVLHEEEVGRILGKEGVRIMQEDREKLGALGRRCFMVSEV